DDATGKDDLLLDAVAPVRDEPCVFRLAQKPHLVGPATERREEELERDSRAQDLCHIVQNNHSARIFLKELEEPHRRDVPDAVRHGGAFRVEGLQYGKRALRGIVWVVSWP